MPDWTSAEVHLTRLGIFISDRVTGHPVVQVPVYAEVVWSDREQPPSPDGRFEEFIGRSLRDIDERCDSSLACRTKVFHALRAVLASVLPQSVRDDLAGDPARAIDLFSEVLHRAKEREGVASFDDSSPGQLLIAIDHALREVSERRDLRVTAARELATTRATYPLGVLSSDHVGYLSFDLSRLPA